jgi:FlaA1/EpsC-like NDP-sugar epimerase
MIEKIKKIVISKYIYVVLFDILLSVFSTYLAYSLRIESYHIPSTLSINTYFICAISFIPIFIYFDIYDTNESFTSPEKLKKIIFAILTYSLFLLILFSSLKNGTPRSIAIIQPLIFFPILCISRILNSLQSSINNDSNVPNLIIYGAGEAGAQLANLIREKNTYRVIGFIDNDLKKIGKFIKNVKIYDEENISHLINKFTVKNIIIAIPSMKISDRRNLVKKLNKYNIETKILPDLNDLINHNISIDDLRELNIDDLLDREIKTNNETIHILSKKIVLITGAGGSIGSELSKQIIFQNPREVILLDNSEFNLYHIQEDLKKLIEFHSPKIECKITPMLLSINNYERLELLFNEKNQKLFFMPLHTST